MQSPVQATQRTPDERMKLMAHQNSSSHMTDDSDVSDVNFDGDAAMRAMNLNRAGSRLSTVSEKALLFENRATGRGRQSPPSPQVPYRVADKMSLSATNGALVPSPTLLSTPVNATAPSSLLISRAAVASPLVHNSVVTMASRELGAYVGFANVTNQVYRRAVKMGFDFTLMVVGQCGLGKSTFINALFSHHIKEPNVMCAGRPPTTTEIKEHMVHVNENGVQVNVTLVDTPGFGDAVDNSECWKPIVEYMEDRFSDYFDQETRVERQVRIPDRRVHCCLYFIAPTAHGLRAVDVECLRAIHQRVNVVPVLAKADAYTADELLAMKQAVRRDLLQANIKIYEFPPDTTQPSPVPTADATAPPPRHQPDMSTTFLVSRHSLVQLESRVPFAVVSSEAYIDKLVDGRKQRVRVRKYAWGTVEVDNLEHNDFVALRDVLIRSHLIDMVEVTACVHYENFRVRQLTHSARAASVANLGRLSPTTIERERILSDVDAERVREQRLYEEKSDKERIFDQKVTELMAALASRRRDLEQNERDLRLKIESMSIARDDLSKRVEEQRTETAAARIDAKNMVSPTSQGSGGKKEKRRTLGVFNHN